ncbi:hypothetical protein QFZ51_006205 [Chitinophaga sp. W3I9]
MEWQACTCHSIYHTATVALTVPYYRHGFVSRPVNADPHLS